MDTNEFTLLIENRDARGARMIRLKRPWAAALAVLLFVQILTCGAAVWTIWQTWEERQAWRQERQVLLVRLAQAENAAVTRQLPPAEPPAPPAKSAPAISPPEPQAPEQERPAETVAPPAPEQDTFDTGAAGLENVTFRWENGRLFCTLTVVNARPGSVLTGQASAWLVDMQGQKTPMTFADPSFSIRNLKPLTAVAAATHDGTTPQTGTLWVELIAAEEVILRISLPVR